MNIRFSSSLKNVLSLSREEAEKLGSDYIGIGHVFLGLIRENQNAVVALLLDSRIAISELKREIEMGIEKERVVSWNSKGKSIMISKKIRLFGFLSAPSRELRLNREVERAIRGSVIEVKQKNKSIVEPEDLLQFILKDADSLWSPILTPLF